MENIIKNEVNNSTLIHPAEIDFFGETYSDTALKEITLVIFIIGTVFGLIAEFGIIWYERNGNHRYRTVINQLFATRSWVVVFYILSVYFPDGIRYWSGPLDATFCDIHNFLRNFLMSCSLLTLDCIIALRYIFIFKLSNFAVMNDDLIAAFLQTTILILSLWIALVKRMSIGRMPLPYYLCAGRNPNEADESDEVPNSVTRKFDSTSILMCISVILHIFAFTKIFWYQRKTEQRTENIRLGRIDPKQRNDQGQNVAGFIDRQIIVPNLPKSMADLTTQLLAFTFIIVLGTLTILMNRTDPIQLNEYENRWLVYFNQIIGTTVAILGITAQYYMKNTSLPKAIWRNIKEKM